MYLTLVPIMGGVAYASASELNFNMLQFVAAMVLHPKLNTKLHRVYTLNLQSTTP